MCLSLTRIQYEAHSSGRPYILTYSNDELTQNEISSRDVRHELSEGISVELTELPRSQYGLPCLSERGKCDSLPTVEPCR